MEWIKKKLAGDSEIQGAAESSINTLYTIDILAGPSRVYIRASMAVFEPAVEDHMQKFCKATAFIALIKYDTVVDRKTPLES